VADARIESQRQLEALKTRFDQVQGALALHQIVQQQLDQQIKSYLENVAVVAGIELDQGDKVTVDWSNGDVTIEHPQPMLLGQAELVANGVAHGG
jgi:hypothetical protein